MGYLRGDRTKEQAQTNGTLRTRTGILGDIVNSSPVYVAKANAALYERATFSGASIVHNVCQEPKQPDAHRCMSAPTTACCMDSMPTPARRPMPTVPNSRHPQRPGAALSSPTYEHRYFVDGEVVVTDVYDTAGSGGWKTILVGTLGRGGPGVFALDVTNPAAVKFLWEKSGTDIASMGKNIGRPVITQVADGDWRVILSSGHGDIGGLGAADHDRRHLRRYRHDRGYRCDRRQCTQCGVGSRHGWRSYFRCQLTRAT